MIAFSASNYRFFDKKTPPYPLIKRSFLDSLLYHTKNYQGTITSFEGYCKKKALYHTKNYQGTITQNIIINIGIIIIPYQELSGNYNYSRRYHWRYRIIPYQELSGNYNTAQSGKTDSFIIPYQELSGNYNGVTGSFLGDTIIPYQELSGEL